LFCAIWDNRLLIFNVLREVDASAGQQYQVREKRGWMSPISKGERVRMSKLGAERCPRIADKHGTVVGGGYYNTVIRVLFDDSKSPVSLHRDYLEKV